MTAKKPSETLLRSHNLGLEITQEPVFTGISVSLNKGNILALTGPSGSGKTVFLEVLAQKRAANAGNIELSLPQNKHDILYLSQEPRLCPFFSVERQLHRWAKSPQMRLALPAVIEYLQLAYYIKTPLRKLSTGWRARLMLARLMLQPRMLWLLDDCAAWLDDTGQLMLKGLAAGHLRKGGGIVATGKDMAAVKAWLPDDAPVQWLDTAQFLDSDPAALDTA